MTAARVHIFRVEEGIGNAILIELEDHTGIVVDWGTEMDAPLSAVHQTVTRLRAVIATHDHADHTVGIANLLQACRDRGIAVDRLVYPTSQLRDRCSLTLARLKARALKIPSHAIRVESSRDGPVAREVVWDDSQGWEVRVLAPQATVVAEGETRAYLNDAAAGNPTSAVVLFRFTTSGTSAQRGAGQVLLPGDATASLLRDAEEVARHNRLTLDNQVLVVPHHGGRKAMPGWLQHSVHGIVVVSGSTASKHHPGVTTLKHLVTHTCAGMPKRLFCTSYARACREHFAAHATAAERSLVEPGACFGHIVVRLTAGGSAEVVEHEENGHERRRFGWCGNIATPSATS